MVLDPEANDTANVTPAVCGARARRTGAPCQRPPVAGRTRCRQHGGASLRGIESATFTSGRRSRYLPTHLAKRFEEALADPELLSLRAEIAVIDVRLSELLERAGADEPGVAWGRTQQLWRDFRGYRAAGDVESMQQALERLAEPIAIGVAVEHAWAEIGTLLDRRGRLCTAERKRLQAVSGVLSVEEVGVMAARIVDVLQRHIDDTDTLHRIGAELVQHVPAGTAPLALVARRRRR